MQVNHKRIYRLYRAAGLMVKRLRRRYGVAVERERLSLPNAPNQVWSMDFVFDALSTGRRIKCLTMVDAFAKESVGIGNLTLQNLLQVGELASSSRNRKN